ncbi:MAG: STAS domain-containing protein [Acidimicrobiales bacterium]|nr:STAS domain-containing protein [Acidimicrobiales bacterium]
MLQPLVAHIHHLRCLEITVALAVHPANASQYPLTHSSLECIDGRSIVWLRGEHDAATVGELSRLIADAIAATSSELIVDVSGVEFMDAGPVGVLLDAREAMTLLSRSLILRAPSRSAKLIFDLCAVAWEPPRSAPTLVAGPVSRGR